MFQTDYLSSAEALQPFYQYSPQSPDFLSIIKKKSFSDIQRKALVEVLREQYSQVGDAEKTRENIEKLLSPNTYTLTTGHQLCLMGGPLFTIYKVLTVINLAEELKLKHADYQFVPIFWIHTEDHDFEEINHFFDDFVAKKKYEGHFVGAVGRHIIEAQIKEIIPKDFPENLQNCFSVGKTWTQAYRQFMHELLGQYGIVMLDADDKRLKSFFAPIVQAELQEQIAQKCILESNKALSVAGYKPQVQPQAINLFYLDAAGRNRIEVSENEAGERIFTLHNRPDMRFSAQQMQRLVRESPELFSPNVCLRPLYQEMILPNLAYIGGWAEVAYWLQFKGTFDYFGINFPLVLPRFSATLFRKEAASIWELLGFLPEDIQKKTADLWEEYAQTDKNLVKFEAWKAEMMAVWEKGETLFEGNPRLNSNLVGQKKKFDAFFQHLYKKQLHFLREKNRTDYNCIRAIKFGTQPDNVIQERVLNIAAFDIPYQRLISIIKRVCKPLLFQHTYITVGKSFWGESDQ